MNILPSYLFLNSNNLTKCWATFTAFQKSYFFLGNSFTEFQLFQLVFFLPGWDFLKKSV